MSVSTRRDIMTDTHTTPNMIGRAEATDAIEQVIEQAIIDGLPQWFFDHDYDDGLCLTNLLESATPKIIAAVRDELLSSPAISAMTRRLVEVSNERAGIDDDVWPDNYNDIHVIGMMEESVSGMTAALDAVTRDPA